MSQNESSFDPYMQETKRAETIHVRAEAGKSTKSAACKEGFEITIQLAPSCSFDKNHFQNEYPTDSMLDLA